MNFLKYFTRKHPVSAILIVAIWILCLIPIPDNVPLGDVPMMDKWTHFVMYGTLCTTLWAEKLRKEKACLITVAGYTIMPILMSGVIELAQAYCTGGTRSGEWLDFAANSIGVALGNVIGILLAVYLAKVKKGS